MHETHMYHDNVQEIGARKGMAAIGEHCISMQLQAQIIRALDQVTRHEGWGSFGMPKIRPR